MNSPEQDQWQDIAAGIRSGLAKLVPLIPAMKVEEVTSFISACNDAMWLEVKANSHDVEVDNRQKVLEREAQFGG